MQTQVQHVVVRNRGLRLRAKALILPSRDLVQIPPVTVPPNAERAKPLVVPAGAIWRPNGQLAKDTNGQSTHARYDDLYDLLRGGRHVVRRYGASSSVPASETAEVAEDIATARAFVRFVLAMGVYLPDEKRAFLRIQAELVGRYVPKRNERKVTARERFMRGMIMKDATGRENRPAAAMVSGAGIGHLLTRVQDIRRISTCIDRRTVCVFGYIEEHLELYKELWAALSTSRRSVDRGMFQRYLDACDDPRAHRAEAALRATERLLIEFRTAFRTIVARPFCRNARRTVRDLDRAIAYCRAGDRARLRFELERIRRGIRWTFVLHALQAEVLSPLSYLMEQLVREERKRMRDAGLPRGRVSIRREMSPDRFAAIEKSLVSFLHRLEKCSDQGLAAPVKDNVDVWASLAKQAMSEDAWFEAKALLLRAAKLL